MSTGDLLCPLYDSSPSMLELRSPIFRYPIGLRSKLQTGRCGDSASGRAPRAPSLGPFYGRTMCYSRGSQTCR